jgi:octaprenyl-diphosphate synthase
MRLSRAGSNLKRHEATGVRREEKLMRRHESNRGQPLKPQASGLKPTIAEPAPGVDSITEPVSAELALVRSRVLEAVPSVPRLAKLSPAARHILGKNGKYLRPALVLLSCGLCGENPGQAVDCAAVMELLHVGSLVFDDLLDGSELRRGRKTVNALWDNQTALLCGTHLLLETANRTAFESPPVRDVLMGALNAMFQGEVLQFASHGKFDLDEDTYMDIITGKSASMMSACARMGALAAGDSARDKLMGEFGLEFGVAFQIRDDLLDLFADAGKLGKELGSDLRDARMTLPLIHCAKTASRAGRRFLKSIFGTNNGSKMDVKRLAGLMESTGSVTYCMEKAHALIQKALSRLDAFEDSQYKSSLAALCRFAVERDY